MELYSIPLLKTLIKRFGKTLMNYCKKCDGIRFDMIFEYLYGDREDLCFNCLVHARIFKKVADLWIMKNNFDSQILLNIYNNIALRKVFKNFFKGIATFGLSFPLVTGAPLSVVWNYTKDCNLKCSHCFSDSKFKEKSEAELSTEEAKLVIDDLAANDVVTINFCGGEPLVRDDIFEVMEYAKENEIYPSISTNATLLNTKICQKLLDCGVKTLSISLDSLKPELHDRLRNVPGALEQAKNGLLSAIEFGKFDGIIVNTTLADFNYEEIPEIYEYLKNIGVKRYYVSRILPTGRGKYYMEHDINPDKKRSVLKFMAEKFIENIEEKNELSVLGRGLPYFSKTCYDMSNGSMYPVCEILTGYENKYQNMLNGKASNLVHRFSHLFSGCATGLFYCGLDSDGNVIPCAPAGEIKLGNILEKGLREIWVNNPILNNVRKREKVKGKCASCSSKKYCGGCRLTAYGVTGDWLESDPSCPY